MLDPVRLRVLTSLREEAGLTLSDMAKTCGLSSNQGRSTAGAWEQGKWRPHKNRRIRFIGYLWDDLRLRRNPNHFQKVWNVLFEEWSWDPISEIECQQWGIKYSKADPSSENQLSELLYILRTMQEFSNISINISIHPTIYS